MRKAGVYLLAFTERGCEHDKSNNLYGKARY